MHYQDVDEFQEEYLQYNFDVLLFKTNNYLVNSDAHYITQKQRYLDDTMCNIEAYKRVLPMVKDTYMKIDSDKFYMTIRDKKEIDDLKKEIKDIILRQKRLLNNFLHYIEYLNTNKHRYTVDYPIQNSPSPSIKSAKSTKSTKSTTSKKSIKGLFSKIALTPKRNK